MESPSQRTRTWISDAKSTYPECDIGCVDKNKSYAKLSIFQNVGSTTTVGLYVYQTNHVVDCNVVTASLALYMYGLSSNELSAFSREILHCDLHFRNMPKGRRLIERGRIDTRRVAPRLPRLPPSTQGSPRAHDPVPSPRRDDGKRCFLSLGCARLSIHRCNPLDERFGAGFRRDLCTVYTSSHIFDRLERPEELLVAIVVSTDTCIYTSHDNRTVVGKYSRDVSAARGNTTSTIRNARCVDLLDLILEFLLVHADASLVSRATGCDRDLALVIVRSYVPHPVETHTVIVDGLGGETEHTRSTPSFDPSPCVRVLFVPQASAPTI